MIIGNQKGISIFVTLLTIMTVIFSLEVTNCKADTVLSQLKAEKELKDAKQWMVIKEKSMTTWYWQAKQV